MVTRAEGEAVRRTGKASRKQAVRAELLHVLENAAGRDDLAARLSALAESNPL